MGKSGPNNKLDILSTKIFVIVLAIIIFYLFFSTLGNLTNGNKTRSEIKNRMQQFQNNNPTAVTIIQKSRYGEKINDTILRDTSSISKLKKCCLHHGEHTVGRFDYKFIHEIDFGSPERIKIQVYINNYTTFFIPVKKGEEFPQNYYWTNKALKGFLEELNL